MRELLRRQRWWAVRVAVLPLQLLFFAAVSFLLVRSIPGDPVHVLTGGQATEEQYLRIQAELGLDGSLWSQMLRYMGGVLTLDLGESIMTGRPVLTEFATRLPATVELALMGLAVSVLAGGLAAYIAVMRPRNLLSSLIRGYARIAGGLPEFAVGVTAIFIFYAVLGWAPAPMGRLAMGVAAPAPVTGFPYLDTILTGSFEATASMTAHLVLPVAVIVLAQTGVLVKLLIVGLEEAVDAAPTRFRIVSGAPRRTVLLSMYRRALPPSVTTCGTLFGYSLGGAVIVESLFGFSGIGQYLVDAVATGDIIAMQGFLIIVAAISLLVFLSVDLINMLLDPRRRPGVRLEATA